MLTKKNCYVVANNIIIMDNQTYDTCVQASRPEIDLDRKISRTHNSSVTTLPVELPSPWEQGDVELSICIQVLLVPEQSQD